MSNKVTVRAWLSRHGNFTETDPKIAILMDQPIPLVALPDVLVLFEAIESNQMRMSDAINQLRDLGESK